MEWCMWVNISEVLGVGNRFPQGEGRRDLCTTYKGFPLLFLTFAGFGQVEWLFIVLVRWFQVLLDDGRTERVMLAQQSGLEASDEAVTEYRLLGPMINGCSWIELRPHTSRKHQVPWTFSFYDPCKKNSWAFKLWRDAYRHLSCDPYETSGSSKLWLCKLWKDA